MTNTTRKSGEQHIQIGLSRIIAIGKIHVLLLNSCIGVYACPSVNCDNAQGISESTLEKMVGVKESEFFYKRKDQATTIRTKNGVKVDGEIVQFEPHGLFQKLAVAAERTDNIDPETIVKHELTTIPKVLSETPELLHEAQTSTLADTLWTTANPNATSIPDNVRYVLDGGALLHRIPWL